MNGYNILSPETKKGAVRLHLEEGRTKESLVMEYGVAKSSINRWTNEFRKECQNDSTAKEGLINRPRQEVADLKRRTHF